MSRNERIRDRYPVFGVYGQTHEFLDADATVGTTVEGRIRGIWPFIVGRVLEFASTLKPRERVNFDPEDILTELWVALAERDSAWTPGRGKYLTFAAVIIDHELCSIRDRSRTVHSPRNSSCRTKKYREEEGDGTITDRKARTAADIDRTRQGTVGLPVRHGRGPERHDGYGADVADAGLVEPLVPLTGTETAAENRDAIRRAARYLTPFEAGVVGRLYGLWGKPPASVYIVAWEIGREQIEVRRAHDRAKAKIRKYLRSISHPTALSFSTGV